ncbi:MAG TPA: hypothetical protein VKP69_02145 [Isosphaeraceae bacterium]|nr:hypothetical protein [Isosphaeraceae bacterium]
MGRTNFSRTPQSGELGEKLLQTFVFRTMTQVIRAERRQSGLAVADLMQELQRVQRGEFGSERLLDAGRDRRMSQEAVARSRGLVILLLDLGALADLGPELERWLEIIHIRADHAVKASQALAGDQAREALIAHEPADDGAILLLDPSLVILLVGPRACELDLLLLAIAPKNLIDEGAIIICIIPQIGTGN